MPRSKPRRSLRVLAGLALLAVAGLAYLVWQQNQPAYYWRKAQAAFDAGRLPEARIYLRNLLDRCPEHGEGHRSLAALCLEEAKEAGRPATYATHPEAMELLARAASLLPEDTELQKTFVTACLSGQRHWLSQAVQAAERVVPVEPDHGDSLFLLAQQAVEKGKAAEAETLLKKLDATGSSRPFQVFAMKVQNAEARKQRDRALRILAEAARHAGQLDARGLESLGPAEWAMMPRLLVRAVQCAETPQAAVARAADAVAALEQLAAVRPEQVRSLAEYAAMVWAVLSPTRSTATAHAVPVELTERLERLCAAAMAAGDCAASVYLQSAAAAFERNDAEGGVARLKKGLEAGEKRGEPARKELLDLHLLAARRLIVLRRYAEAEEHLAALLQDKATAGWGHFLAGSIAMEEGKFKKAHDHLLQAQGPTGNALPLRVALARTLVALGQWADALVYLESLHVPAENLEQQRIVAAGQAEAFLGRVHLDEARAHLELFDWAAAEPHLAAVQGTTLEPIAEVLAVEWLTTVGKDADARQRLADARRRFPGDVGLFQLELAHLQQDGQGEAARKLLEQFAAATPADLSAQLLLHRSRAAGLPTPQAMQQLEELEKRLAKTDADRQAILQERILTLLTAGQTGDAAALTLTLDNPQPAARIALVQGVQELAAGNYADSLELFAKTLEVTALHQQTGTALLRAVAMMTNQCPPAEVAAEVEKLFRRFPKEPVVLLAKAAIHFRQGRFNAGMELLDAVKQLDPANTTARLLEAEQWLRSGKPDRALGCIERVLEYAPQDVVALLMAAYANLATNHHEAAIAFADRALAADPSSAPAVLFKADALTRCARRDEAQTLLEELVRTQPTVPHGHSHLASMYFAAGRQEKALEVYRAGRKHLPGDPTLLLGEMSLLAATGRPLEAQRVAEQAGDNPGCAFCLAAVRFFVLQKRLDVARQWCLRAEQSARGPEKATVHSFLGSLALRQAGHRHDPKLLAEARDQFGAAVAVDPRNIIAANNLAWLLATEFHQPEQALRVVEQAFGAPAQCHVPREAVHTVAVVCRMNDRLDDAHRLLQSALTWQPGEPLLLLELGKVLYDLRRPTEAAIMLERAIRLRLEDKDAAEARFLLEQIQAGKTPSRSRLAKN